jgi:TRAP transporter TAXI family solute receptor
MSRRTFGLSPALLVFALAAAACARGADEQRLKTDLQERLNHDVKQGLFEVVGLRREGSGPLPAGEGGAARVVVYFNATLRLAEDYKFGGWDQLGPSSLAYALGATEKGIFGLKAENAAGDVVRAYGSAVYENRNGTWTLGTTEAATAAAAPNIEGSSPPSRSKQLIDKLAALVELPPPGVPATQDEIIAEELARASENIERRVRRREHTFTVATGPEQGEYARFGAALISAVNAAAPNVQLRQRHTEGSVENAWLLSRGEADYAIVQGDVAAAAYEGNDLFARGGPLGSLRAVGGMFPEAIHIAVLLDSPIDDIKKLRGRRVAVGTPASGTRFDAVAVLAGYGLESTDLAELCEEPLSDALKRLQRKELDAVFATGAAPTRALQQFAVTPGMRLLSIDDDALTRLLEERPGLSRITLPPNTYPRQRQPIVTAAATALLLTTADAPSTEVQRVTDLVFTRMPQQNSAGADVVRVSSGGERRGVTVPLHPGAVRPPQ